MSTTLLDVGDGRAEGRGPDLAKRRRGGGDAARMAPGRR
ncbi:MAG: hypothetical protein JWO21_1479, partial [Solirubrobacterales bacterium]|nr:hypothetical protein [Solirubrobacterales bacterium]